MAQPRAPVTPATFRFKNIGPIKDATLQLGNLTVIAGRNNTGKSYIAYTLYGFLKMWDETPPPHHLATSFFRKPFPTLRMIANSLSKDGHATVPTPPETLKTQREKLVRDLARVFSRRFLPRVFSSQPDNFRGATLDINFSAEFTDQSHSSTYNLFNAGRLSIQYDGTNLLLATHDLKQPLRSRDLEFYIPYHYFLFLLQRHFPRPFILSAERFGISLFYKDLDYRKHNLVDYLQKLPDTKSREGVSARAIIDRATSRYALPIKDNIDFTRSIPDLRGQRSDFYEDKLFGEIREMMDGQYGATGDDIRFISRARRKDRSFNIPLHIASSSARGLSDLYFFLRHVAAKGTVLIIDEPESHLDTANQVQFARLLAKLVQTGIHVIVTTHSDYLIKEFNNLIMLSGSFPDKEAVMRRLKYEEDEALHPDTIRAYVAEDGGLTQCAVDRFGVNMPMFDETIDEINSVANELALRLEDDGKA